MAEMLIHTAPAQNYLRELRVIADNSPQNVKVGLYAAIDSLTHRLGQLPVLGPVDAGHGTITREGCKAYDPFMVGWEINNFVKANPDNPLANIHSQVHDLYAKLQKTGLEHIQEADDLGAQLASAKGENAQMNANLMTHGSRLEQYSAEVDSLKGELQTAQSNQNLHWTAEAFLALLAIGFGVAYNRARKRFNRLERRQS